MKIRRFFIYGILGWIVEIVWTSFWNGIGGDINLTGITYAWMLPIYGLAVFLEDIHQRIRKWSWYSRGIIWMAIIFCIEYGTGWLLEQMIGRCPWDYSWSPFSIHGYIRLDYAPAWFVAGLLFEKIHDFLDRVSILGEINK